MTDAASWAAVTRQDLPVWHSGELNLVATDEATPDIVKALIVQHTRAFTKLVEARAAATAATAAADQANAADREALAAAFATGEADPITVGLKAEKERDQAQVRLRIANDGVALLERQIKAAVAQHSAAWLERLGQAADEATTAALAALATLENCELRLREIGQLRRTVAEPFAVKAWPVAGALPWPDVDVVDALAALRAALAPEPPAIEWDIEPAPAERLPPGTIDLVTGEPIAPGTAWE